MCTQTLSASGHGTPAVRNGAGTGMNNYSELPLYRCTEHYSETARADAAAVMQLFDTAITVIISLHGVHVDVLVQSSKLALKAYCTVYHKAEALLNFKQLNKKDYLGVVHSEFSTLFQQSLSYKDSWALTCVTSVFLECKAKQSNALASNSVEHLLQHVPGEPLLLEVIQCYHLVPVQASSIVTSK
jgi:hypothetical protein